MKRLDAIEASMSLYQKDSEIMRLSRGEVIEPSADFRRVLELSLEHGKKTEGAFDITIWPALSAIQATIRETGLPPAAQALLLLKERVDSRNVELSAGRLSFKVAGTQVTTDGVAKGYAVDEVAKLLRGSGVSSYLLNFSGNMRVEGAGWWTRVTAFVRISNPPGKGNASL
jgi:thiamine biosynthesis lipoprotein